jgi:hypothetical protein
MIVPLLVALFVGTDLLDAKTRDLLLEALSGERAKDHVIAITRHHRIQGSRGYREAAKYVLEELHRAGFSEQEATVESFPSDGKALYQTWQSPSGWDIEAAELRMLEPTEERIVGYPEIAMSVITYSNAGEATGELIDVGAGTSEADYQGKNVAGKVVLASGYGGAVHRLAVLAHGAKFVVCYLDDERALEHPDMLQYTGMWPKSDELERTTFGFNLTHRQGERLKALLAAGKKVVLRGSVRGRGLEPFFMDVVVATIRGASDEELVFSAHLDHPKESANDNASGSGAILDIARTLHELIASGRLPKPRRTFRFLWVPEWNGTMAYIDRHPELCGPALGGKVLANMNLDMVGENLELLHSKLILTRTPASLPSVVNDVVEEMARMVDEREIHTPRGGLSAFNYRVTPYSGGSDHMMMIDRKIPAVMFSHGPDYTHHTSEDTPDKVDPVELERCELIAAATLWYLANLDEAQATALLELAKAHACARLLEGEARTRALGAPAGPVRAETLASLDSLLTFYRSPALVTQVNDAKQVVQSLARAPAPVPDSPDHDARVPMRLTRGPLAFDLPESRLAADAAAAWYRTSGAPLTGDVRFEVVNFIDGVRTVGQIGDAIAAEFGAIPQDVLTHYVDDLVRIGVVQWAKP